MPRRSLIRPQGRILVAFLMAWNAGCWSSWQVVQPEGAGFAVELPGPAECGPNHLPTDWGPLEGGNCFSREGILDRWWPDPSRQVRFAVSWIDLPPEFDRREWPRLYESIKNELMMEGSFPEFEKAIVRDQAITMSGQSGTEFELASWLRTSPASRSAWRVRSCVHEGRLFRLAVIGNPERFEARGWGRVIESFRFVER